MKKLSLMLILSVSMLILTFLGTGKIDKLEVIILLGLCIMISYKLGEQRRAILVANRVIESMRKKED